MKEDVKVEFETHTPRKEDNKNISQSLMNTCGPEDAAHKTLFSEKAQFLN